jgi:hypothetical protein
MLKTESDKYHKKWISTQHQFIHRDVFPTSKLRPKTLNSGSG